ncbi:MAG: DUF4214 domain-containing protein [Huintestinicola sp.]|uniref:DUF4214 domain-containing protein n=1 Tax=Huintestinicola sp. TaxID=2981661 RepID=UPI003F072E31
MKGKKILGAVPAVLALCMAMAPGVWAEDELAAAPETEMTEYTERETGNVSINSTNFPDAVFRAYISEKLDWNQDNILSEEEINGATGISIYDSNLSSIKGIEHFTKLVHLSLDGNMLTSVDLSKNTALEELDLSSNQLTSLDVTNNTALRWLTCNDNKLTSLNVSKNTDLTYFRCGNNQLTSLDVSKNTALTTLYCGGNKLTSLDLSKNTVLTDLSCDYGNLTTLDLSYNTALENVSCFGNKLTSLNVRNCTYLISLSCDQNQLTSLDVTNNTALEWLYCYENQLTSLNVSNNTALIGLYCGGNKLTSLDVTNNPALDGLECNANKLTSLNVSKNTALTLLDCDGNQITSLDVSKNTSLQRLYCNGNQLTSLNVSNNTALTRLDCGGNKLTSIDVSKNTALMSLGCQFNQIGKLDVSKNTGLTELNCGNNNLTTLDVSKNTALEELTCSGNPLTSLDVSKNTSLTGLYCFGGAYEISAVSGRYTLSSLPAGFDPAKASNWKGATYDSSLKSLKNFTNQYVYYDYNCGNGFTGTFTLYVKNYGEIDPVSDFVERLYVNLLGRASDPKGKANHVNSIRSGKSACDVAKNFVLSTELANKKLSNKEFVTRMYKTMLDRNPDAKGLARWTAALDNGCSYGYVLQGFGKSAEFTRLCESYGVTRGSYTSPEYRDRNEKLTAYVSRLYTVALGRKYDIKGLNNHTGRYINGTKTAEEIAYSFVFSTEFKNKKLTDEQFVDCMYNSLFGRTADAGGKNRWLTKMKNGMTREQVFKGFTSSAEFKAMVAKFGL